MATINIGKSLLDFVQPLLRLVISLQQTPGQHRLHFLLSGFMLAQQRLHEFTSPLAGFIETGEQG